MTILTQNVISGCPRCGGSNIFWNNYGVGQCQHCGLVLETGVGRRAGFHRDGFQRTSTKRGDSTKLEEAARFYGLCLRRFKDQVRKGRVLGVRYADGHYTFLSEPDEVKGPLADKPQEFLLPLGTRGGIHLEVCSGSVISGCPYVVAVNLERKHPVGTAQCEDGYSGSIVQVRVQHLDVEPVDYTEP